jgi:peptide/nickel transport system permease protein
MNKLNYIVKRLLQMVPVLLAVTVLIFLLIRMIPGDPASVMLGTRVRPEVLEAYREKMGLHEPVWNQFVYFIRDLARLDFGESLHFHMPVREVIKGRIGVTLALTVFSTLLTVVISLPLGYIAGMKQDKAADQGIRSLALLGLSIPSFWIGLMLLLIFGVKLRWFPISGYGKTPVDHLRSLVLPSLTMAVAASSVIVRNTRNNVVDVRSRDYVDFARGKGLGSLRVSLFHIIRNALIPTVTLLSMRMAYMLGGSVIIESVFTLPGIGELLTSSVLRRDYAVVQGVVITFVFAVLVINLFTDILYSVIDPRITLD